MRHHKLNRPLRPGAMLTAILLVALTCALPRAAIAQAPPVGSAPTTPTKSAALQRYEQLVAQGNNFYNDENYDQARQQYIQAIQAYPRGTAAFRNMARSFFWQNQYGSAVAYYDNYLQVRPTAPDAEQIRKERKLAASRATGEGFAPPEAQRMAAAALERQLDKGSGYTKGGGGAWGIYQTLLRTGYAQPELARLRHDLLEKLRAEFMANITPKSGQPTPTMSFQAWQLELERLQAAAQLTETLQEEQQIDGRLQAVRASLSLLSDADDASTKLARAINANRDLDFLQWFEIAALLKANKTNAALLRANSLVKKVQADSNLQAYARVVQAMVLQRSKRVQEATRAYDGILQR